MATPAAILQIAVEANTSKASAALRTFDKNVARTGTTSRGATKQTTMLNKATGTLGGSMMRAARYASGAAVAYLSIAQAKAAVTTTQELAKTTSALNRNLGLSTKRASQWGSVAKARGVDTKSLTMSFTTLSRRMTDASKGTDSAIDSFKDIGVTQRDLEKTGGDFNKQVLLVADAFGEAEGGAVRQQAAQKLLGRGYQTLLPMFAEGSKSLKEQMHWANEYGTTLDKKALKSQMDLVNAQRESKVAMMGLQVSFATALTPALKVANREFQNIARIMGSDKLTKAEKFRRVATIIGEWGEKAFDAFVEVLPKLAEKAGEAGPGIAAALIRGFLKADIWGKMFLGGWFLAKLGGSGAISSVGSKLGNRLGIKFGRVFGVAAAAYGAHEFAKNFQDDIAGFAGKLFGGSGEENSNLLESLTGIDVGGPARDLLGLEDDKKAINKSWSETLGGITDKYRKHGQSLKSITENTHGRVNETTKRGLDRQKDAFQNTKERVGETTRRQSESVIGNVNSMVGAVSQGLNRLKDNTNKALQAFGVKKVAFNVASDVAKGANKLGRQRGGPINQGAPSGDSVPALLERGEYVLNRKAVAAVGKDRLDHLNFGAASRFQVGGLAGLEPGISRLAKWANQRYGLTVSSGLRPGDTDSFHGRGQAVDLVPPSMNATVGIYNAFKNQLAELFYDPWGGFDSGQRIGAIGGHMDHIHAAIAGAGGPVAMAKKLKRLMLNGPDGPLKSMGQSALDKAHKAANRFISRQAPSHGNLGVPTSGPLQAIARKMVSARWGKAQWPFFNDLVMRESGWDPTAVNPSSGAAGLAQALPPSKYPAGAWPYRGKSSAVKQLQWMVNYISGRYGNPAGAIAFHDANNWYQKGGQVLPYAGNFQGGGTVPGRIGQPMAAVVHGGERISDPNHFNSDKAIQALLKEFVANQRAILRMSRREKTAIQAALASAASGQIGGRVHLSGQTPVAGSFASY